MSEIEGEWPETEIGESLAELARSDTARFSHSMANGFTGVFLADCAVCSAGGLLVMRRASGSLDGVDTDSRMAVAIPGIDVRRLGHEIEATPDCSLTRWTLDNFRHRLG